ncbi:glycosyltransferase [Nocardioides sp. InS609-2]|uniref:glycosyltransferase n=1 Tax=Nocardioides sp. InS609-2 TaxID=2760705 RepID=UPI0020BF733C|nr:glycosyltransferase [Nocardioides sp. InS609-2]
MTPRRIALVTESFYPAVDGTTTTLKNVADHLVDTGHDVLLVAPGPGLTSYRSMPVVRIAPPRRGRQVRDALAGFGPDLVHVTSPGALGRRALDHAGRLGLPTLLVQHSPMSHVPGPADRLVVTSRWMADRMAALGVDASVWQPGVDTAAFAPSLRDDWLHQKWARSKSAPGPRVVVGYAGSLHKRHGVRRLAELAGMPDIRLVVIGDGPQRAWLQAHLPGAKFTGALETGELATALASLDVLVHPGTEETCCHVHREAAASGVPVVAPHAGGVVGLVRSLETGLTYDAGDPRALRRAVESVAGDRQRRLLGERGRELAATRDWADACTELDAIYDEVLGAPHSASVRHLRVTG